MFTGQKLKEIRKKLGLNQSEMAKLLKEKSKQTISNWENERRYPRPLTQTVYEIFDTSTEEEQLQLMTKLRNTEI